MRKMTPMILVILMLASVLSSIDVYELQEQNEFEEDKCKSLAQTQKLSMLLHLERPVMLMEATNQ